MAPHSPFVSGIPLDNNWPFTIKPQSSPTGFTCLAVGNIDLDSFPDVWTIDEKMELKCLLSDVGDKTNDRIYLGGPPKIPIHWLPLYHDGKTVLNLLLLYEYQLEPLQPLPFIIILVGPLILIWLLYQDVKFYFLLREKRRP